MSVRVMSLVWDSTVPAPERFTLLALADRADEDGKCWPSVPTLARKCRTGESTIRRHIKALRALGVLRVRHRMNDSSMYQIVIVRLLQLVDPAAQDSPSQPDSPSQSDGGRQSRKGAQPDPAQIDTPPDLTPPNLSTDPSQIDQTPPPRLSTHPSQSERLSTSDPSVDPPVIHQGARERARTPRASRLPEDFTVTPEMVAWARANVPHVDGRRETEKFVDHWRSASGAAARKTDWVAAWRNWMRKADERPTAVRRLPNGSRTPTTTQRVNDALALLRPEED